VRLSAYLQTARDLGFKAVSTNDHLISARPWLDAPTALAAVLSHSGDKAAGVQRVFIWPTKDELDQLTIFQKNVAPLVDA